MPGRRGGAKRVEHALEIASGTVSAVAQSGAVALLDCRLPSEIAAANQAALEQFKRRAAPFYAAIRTGAEQYGEFLRAELNALAGGEAPPSVMALAQAAIDAHANCQLAQHIVGHATGDLEALPDEKQQGRRLEITQLQRTAMGLDVAFTDLVRRATEAARAEAGKRTSATDQLMARLGHGQLRREVAALSPLQPPGGVAIGAPHAPLPTPSGDSE